MSTFQNALIILSDGLSSFTTSAMFHVPKKGIYYTASKCLEMCILCQKSECCVKTILTNSMRQVKRDFFGGSDLWSSHFNSMKTTAVSGGQSIDLLDSNFMPGELSKEV